MCQASDKNCYLVLALVLVLVILVLVLVLVLVVLPELRVLTSTALLVLLDDYCYHQSTAEPRDRHHRINHTRKHNLAVASAISIASKPRVFVRVVVMATTAIDECTNRLMQPRLYKELRQLEAEVPSRARRF